MILLCLNDSWIEVCCSVCNFFSSVAKSPFAVKTYCNQQEENLLWWFIWATGGLFCTFANIMYSRQHFPYERKTLYQFLVFWWYDQVLVGLVFCYRSAKCHIVFVKSKMLNENLAKFLVDTKYDIFSWWNVFSDFLLSMINPSFHWWANFLSSCSKHKLSQSFF